MTEKQEKDLAEALVSMATLCGMYAKYKCVELAIWQLQAGGSTAQIEMVILSAKEIYKFISNEDN